jgi:hypothetical protein
MKDWRSRESRGVASNKEADNLTSVGKWCFVRHSLVRVEVAKNSATLALIRIMEGRAS